MSIIWNPAGTALSAEEKELLQHPYSSGLILFADNYENPQQLRELTDTARSICPGLLISTDHEGGKVQRFLTGFTKLPAAAAFGALAAKQPESAKHLAGICGKLVGSELRRVGVNLNYAPVLDIAVQLSQNIGGKPGRSWGEDPKTVIMLAGAYIAGLNSAGVAAAGKHFPGHGNARSDSHVELPRDERSPIRDIRDLIPFEHCKDILQGMLTAHVVYPDMDQLPATFSALWLQHVLRGEIGYQKPIISDDLTMGAVKQLYSDRIEDAVDDALIAGNDYLLVCNDRDAILRALKHLDRIRWGHPWRKIRVPQPEFSATESDISLWQKELAKLS